MTVEKNKVVSVNYELRIDNANSEIIEKATSSQPLVFLFGAGNMIPEFETNLEGKEEGHAFDFKIESGKAYGPYMPENVAELPKSIFQAEGVDQDKILSIGNYVDMQDNAGNLHKGKVMEVAAEQVKMDFNHPLAGKDLFFKGEVVAVREATSEELDHGHVHGKGGVEH